MNTTTTKADLVKPKAVSEATAPRCEATPQAQTTRECHKGAMVGEKATPEQIRLWQSLGIIK